MQATTQERCTKQYYQIRIQISFIGRIALVTLSNTATCYLMCETALKLFNYSTCHLNAFMNFFVTLDHNLFYYLRDTCNSFYVTYVCNFSIPVLCKVKTLGNRIEKLIAYIILQVMWYIMF